MRWRRFGAVVGAEEATLGRRGAPDETIRHAAPSPAGGSAAAQDVREHVLLCLIPAFFIAGAIAVFIRQNAVMKYLGPTAYKATAYGVASVSGSVLAVCSCTALLLFAGIYRRGAGLGPAVTFLYAGPAINVLAVVLTAKVLGAELGIARAVGAVAFALVIGGIMHGLYRHEEAARAANQKGFAAGGGAGRPLGETAAFFALQIAVLVFANWAAASADDSAVWHLIHAWKWPLTALAGLGLAGLMIARWGWSWQPLALTAILVALLGLAFPQHPEMAFAAGLLGLTLVALAGADFLWLFLRHVLPKGFRRSRDYGFLHAKRKRLIQLLHLVLRVITPPPTPKVPRCCRECGGAVTLTIVPFLAQLRAPSPSQVTAGSPAM